MSDSPTIFTKTSAFSLAGVAGVGFLAYLGANKFLPKNARWQDRFTFIWLVSTFSRVKLAVVTGWTGWMCM